MFSLPSMLFLTLSQGKIHWYNSFAETDEKTGDLFLAFHFKGKVQLAFNSGSLPELVKHLLSGPVHIQIHLSPSSSDKGSYSAEEQPLETGVCCSWVTVGKAFLLLCFCPLNSIARHDLIILISIKHFKFLAQCVSN